MAFFLSLNPDFFLEQREAYNAIQGVNYNNQTTPAPSFDP